MNSIDLSDLKIEKMLQKKNPNDTSRNDSVFFLPISQKVKPTKRQHDYM